MTNFDLEDAYEFLSHVRYVSYLRDDLSNQKNIILLNRLLEILDKTDGHVVDFRDAFYSKEDENYIRKTYILIPAPRQKLVIEDNAVGEFFKHYFLEIKNLCLTKRYDQVFYLIDKLDNFPGEILKNGLNLPIRKLKKCLTPYWRKYDKFFLRDFVRNNTYASKS